MANTIVIDKKEYKIEELSDKAKGLLQSLRFVDGEINRLNALLAAMKTARSVYAYELKKEVEKKS